MSTPRFQNHDYFLRGYLFLGTVDGCDIWRETNSSWGEDGEWMHFRFGPEDWEIECLTPEMITKMESIGMCWEDGVPEAARQFARNYIALIS